ncbi:hypothetical protein COLO4_04286 [Corchorus olitorius]|uniref:Uncharacterized protein n=1 Tax=Corchorus olitorius TaxID=93759 RepID=A0A1R3KUI2_9ROSI|nr:hypothetical protein COLO4_04641 [Corchorus olitorius]OMP10764.1 hypothetical protein COLO4_04286 [Corchorus olitorius]
MRDFSRGRGRRKMSMVCAKKRESGGPRDQGEKNELWRE